MGADRRVGEQTVKLAFTELAPHYLSTMDRELQQYWGISYPDFVDLLLGVAQVERDDFVLDIATGTAFLPVRLAEMMPVRSLVGLDITHGMLAVGQQYCHKKKLDGKVRLVCASALQMPFVDALFDVALCGLGTHHMHVPDMLNEARRTLQDGGVLVVADVGATPFWRSFWGSLLISFLLLNYRLTHRTARAQAEAEAFSSVRTKDEWFDMLCQAGFNQIHIREISPRRLWYPSGLLIRAVKR